MSLGNSTADFTAQWQKMMTDSWSQWTKNTVSSDSFTSASGAYMDWALSSQKMMSEMSGQMMESLDIPRRSDMARLSAQVQGVEARLLDQEEANHDIRILLLAINAKLDKLTTAQPTTSKPAPPAPAKTVAAESSNGVTNTSVSEPIVAATLAPKTRKMTKKGKAKS